MPLPSRIRNSFVIALAGTPDVLERMLETVPVEAPVWDARPAPERFTLREIVAHLADWEGVFRDRMARTRTQSEPTLQSYDEGQWAIDHGYASADPRESLARFRRERAETVRLARTLEGTEWERIGRHSELGPLTLETQIAQVVAHDGYHTQQVAQWLASGGR